MSRIVVSRLRRSLPTVNRVNELHIRDFSDKSRFARIGRTSAFVQTGLKINELPLVVKRVSDILKIPDPNSSKKDTEEQLKKDFLQTFDEHQAGNSETREIIAGLRRCFTVSGIFRLLETIPANEVTPPVAVEALKLITCLDGVGPDNYRQTLKGVRRLTEAFNNPQSGDTGSETFLRHAFMNMLLETVYKSGNPKVLVEGLELMKSESKDNEHADVLTLYKDKMFEEVLVQVTDGRFSIEEICDAICVLGNYYKDNKKACHFLTDQLWSGLLDKAATELDEKKIAPMFHALPHLKASRNIVLKVLADRVGDYWQKYQSDDILEMLRVLTEIRLTAGDSSKRILKVISQWISKNLHTINEEQLLAIIFCYSKIEYVDDMFENVLERYIKVRGCQIEEANLVAAICDYCFDYRIRSKTILEGVGEYFIANAESLTTPQLHSIAQIYGQLDFHPPNGFKFWDLLEHALEHKFTEFQPRDVVNLLLSFVYIEHYPLNFVRKVFNPYFMDRVHNQEESMIFDTRESLKLFDTSMVIGSPHYNGPFLPKGNCHKTLPLNSKIHSLSNLLVPILGDIVGDVKRIKNDVVLSNLPLNDVYKVDLMICPSAAATLLRLGSKTNNSQIVAVLIHPDEHYDRSGKHLVGQQAMRVRNLKGMGFKVMELKHGHFGRLGKFPQRLQDELRQKYFKALESE